MPSLILDEADEMHDMGFAEGLEAILNETPKQGRTPRSRTGTSRSVILSCVGSSFFAKMLCSCAAAKRASVGDLPELDRGGHGPSTGEGNPQSGANEGFWR